MILSPEYDLITGEALKKLPGQAMLSCWNRVHVSSDWNVPKVIIIKVAKPEKPPNK